MRGKTTLWIVLLMMVLGVYPVLALDNLMALQGTVEDSGQPVDGNLTITIHNQSSGGTLLYNSGTDFNNKIIDGRFDVMLGQATELTLEYGKYYYMDMSVNGQDLDFSGSERQIFQSSVGNIGKSNIASTGTWSEDDIPSLSASWSGSIDGSKISGSASLNVNNSQYLEGLSKNDFLDNDTQLNVRITSVNSSIQNKLDLTDQRFNDTVAVNSRAAAGTCAFGQVVQNTTTGGVQCVAVGSGTVTQVSASGPGLTGGVITGSGSVGLNTSYIDTLYLLLSDQRFNDSTRITNVNSSANLQNLGFNTTAQLDTRYYASSNPSSYITDGNTNWDNIYGLINSTYGNSTYVRIGTSCQCANIADRMYNFTVNANGLCTAVCGSDATSGGALQLADLFSRKYYYREAMFESVTAGFNEPWVGAAIASGTTALVAAESAEHPGTAYLRTSTSASSGYSYQISGATSYLLGDDYSTRTTFKPFSKTGNVTIIRFGFQDVFTTGLPADGVFFNLTQNSTTTFYVSGHSRNNNAQTNTTSTYMIYNNTWYAMKIYINNSNLATFELYNETDLIWSDTVTTNIPTGSGRQTSNAFVAYSPGGTTAQNLAYIDYISIGVNRELIR